MDRLILTATQVIASTGGSPPNGPGGGSGPGSGGSGVGSGAGNGTGPPNGGNRRGADRLILTAHISLAIAARRRAAAA